MHYLTLRYRGDIYRVLYEPSTLDIVEVLWFITSSQAVALDVDELDLDLRNLIEKAMST